MGREGSHPTLEPYSWTVYKGFREYIFGGGWDDIPLAKTLKMHGAVSRDEAMSAICYSKVLYQDQAESNNGV